MLILTWRNPDGKSIRDLFFSFRRGRIWGRGCRYDFLFSSAHGLSELESCSDGRWLGDLFISDNSFPKPAASGIRSFYIAPASACSLDSCGVELRAPNPANADLSPEITHDKATGLTTPLSRQKADALPELAEPLGISEGLDGRGGGI